MRQGEQEFQTNLGYRVRPYLKNKTKQTKKTPQKQKTVVLACNPSYFGGGNLEDGV
jgi:hypothetical protein